MWRGRGLIEVSFPSYTVSPADLSDLHVIRYEPERDLLPLLLSHCQYSVERGQETVSEYDLPKIQQQLLTRFLQGKPLISLAVSCGPGGGGCATRSLEHVTLTTTPKPQTRETQIWPSRPVDPLLFILCL